MGTPCGPSWIFWLDEPGSRSPPPISPVPPPFDLLDDRARLFGARQLLTQQRQLWSLLEARAAARDRR
ncbi:hypothetical protein [Sphingomonas sp.]|uniref:DUF6975 family protein n=1 Tax=Sphingomonas sp. TaxID=28214 RepID=UPI0035C7A91F